MNQFTLTITLQSLKLKVKFHCQLSLTLKYGGKEYPVLSEQPLSDGSLAAPPVCVSGLQTGRKVFPSSHKQEIWLLLYLHSTHGKLQIGSFGYNLGDIRDGLKVREKIKNSPDKQAEINLSLEIKYEQTQSQLIDPIEESKSSLLNGTEITKIRDFPHASKWNSRVDRIDSGEKPWIPIDAGKKPWVAAKAALNEHSKHGEPATSHALQAEHSGLFEIDQAKSKIDKSQPKYAKDQLNSQTHSLDRVQALKRRLSEQKVSKTDSNAPNPNYYLQKIAILNRENKAISQNVNTLQLELRLKENTIKFTQKELQNKKSKNQALQTEINEINKNLSNFQQKSRELEYSLKKKNDQLQEAKQEKQGWTSRMEKREENARNQSKQATEKYYKVEKEKERLALRIQSLQDKVDEKERHFQQQLKDKEKRHNEEKNAFQKKISIIQRSLQQLRSQNNALKTNLQSVHRQLSESKRLGDSYYEQNIALKTRQQELVSQIEMLQSAKEALNSQLQQERKGSKELRKLKSHVEEKDFQIDSLKKYSERIEAELSQQIQRVRQLEINLQNLQQQYEKLYYDKLGDSQELENKKKTMQQLLESHQQLEKKLEQLKIIINHQEIDSHQANSQLQQKLKQENRNHQKLQHTLNQLLQQLKEVQASKRQLAKQAAEFKAEADQQKLLVLKLQDQNQALTRTVTQLKVAEEISEGRIQHLQQKIEVIVKQKEEKEEQAKRLLQNSQHQTHRKNAQIENLALNCDRLQNEVSQQIKIAEQNAINMQYKDKLIDELSSKLKMLFDELKLTTEANSNLSQVNSALKSSIQQLSTKKEQLQRRLQSVNNQINEIEQTLQPPTLQQNKNWVSQHQLKQKIEKLKSNLANKEKQWFQQRHAIQELRRQLQQGQYQQQRLNLQLGGSQRKVQEIGNQLQQNQLHFQETIVLLQNLISKNQQQFASILLQAEQSNSKSQMINGLIQAISKLRCEQQQLKLDLQESIGKQSQLRESLKNLAQSQSQLLAKKVQLEMQLSKMKASQIQQEKQIASLMQSTQDLNKQVSALKGSLQNQTLRNRSLEQLIKNKGELIHQLQQQRQKHQHIIQQMQNNINFTQMSLNEKIERLTLEVAEKAKELALAQNEKKQRVQILGRTIDQVQKTNSDLQALIFSQKSTNLKLNSLFIDLSSALAKIENVHKIKAYSMSSIRDLMGRFEQLVKASAKSYSQYDRKAGKHEEKLMTAQNAAGTDYKNRLKSLNSRYK